MIASLLQLVLITVGVGAQGLPDDSRIPPGRTLAPAGDRVLTVAKADRVLAVAEADPAVEAARDVLQRGWVSPRHPWYDEETDGARLIDLPEPTSSWNFNWLSWLFGWNWRIIGWVMLAVFVAALIYVLVRIFLRRSQYDQREFDAQQQRAATDLDRVEALPFDIKRPPADLLEEARRCYQQGQFGEAIVYLFSYQLVEMDKGQIIHLAKGKTNRHYLREIGPRRVLKQLVERTMVAFEDVFFGRHEIDRPRFETCWSRGGEFELLLKRGG